MVELALGEQIISFKLEEIDDVDAKFFSLAFNGIETKIESHAEAIAKTKGILLKDSLAKAIICSVQVEAISQTETMLGGHLIVSHDFAKHMAGAQQAVVYVATIGEIIEGNLSTREKLFVDSWGASYVDALAYTVEQRIISILTNMGLGVSCRYSPGYGDMKLEEQRVLFSFFDASVIGVELLDSCIMQPLKSMSRILAVSNKQGEQPQSSKCEDCNISETCIYKMG